MEEKEEAEEMKEERWETNAKLVTTSQVMPGKVGSWGETEI